VPTVARRPAWFGGLRRFQPFLDDRPADTGFGVGVVPPSGEAGAKGRFEDFAQHLPLVV